MSVFSTLTDKARKELWATLALRHARGIGACRARLLIETYGNALAAVQDGLSTPSRWALKKLIPSDIAAAFAAECWRTPALAEWNALRRNNCSILLWSDPDYPEPLRGIPDFPLLLYLKGDESLLHSPSVAIVGARDCTREGIAVAAYLARDLSKAGVTIISGMAMGIDRAAHLAALEGPGRSIGILGTGVDVPYPQCNTDLYEELAREGLLISEFPPGTRPAAKHFPIRNRIISGLSLGVLVVEAAHRSGSLITARLALDQGREVFAVPGHTMAAVSGGCRELIRSGAKAVFTADDILLELAPLLHATAGGLAGKPPTGSKDIKSQARKRIMEYDTSLLTGASEVLPEGKLPWRAPKSGLTGKAKQAGTHEIAPSPSFPDAPVPTGGMRSGNPVLDAEEQRILSILGQEPVHIDSLNQSLVMDAGRLSSLLTLLEVRGLVKRSPGMLYSLTRS